MSDSPATKRIIILVILIIAIILLVKPTISSQIEIKQTPMDDYNDSISSVIEYNEKMDEYIDGINITYFDYSGKRYIINDNLFELYISNSGPQINHISFYTINKTSQPKYYVNTVIAIESSGELIGATNYNKTYRQIHLYAEEEIVNYLSMYWLDAGITIDPNLIDCGYEFKLNHVRDYKYRYFTQDYNGTYVMCNQYM